MGHLLCKCGLFTCKGCKAKMADAKAKAEAEANRAAEAEAGTVNAAFDPSSVDQPVEVSNEAVAASGDSPAVAASGDISVANPPGDSTSQIVVPRRKNQVVPVTVDPATLPAAPPSTPHAAVVAPETPVSPQEVPFSAATTARVNSDGSTKTLHRTPEPSPSHSQKDSRSDSTASSCQSSSGASVASAQTVVERPSDIPRLQLQSTEPSSPTFIQETPDSVLSRPGNPLEKEAPWQEDDGSVKGTPPSDCRPESPARGDHNDDKDDKGPRGGPNRHAQGDQAEGESKTESSQESKQPPQEQKTQEKTTTTAHGTPSTKENMDTRRPPSRTGMSSDEADNVTTLSDLEKLNELIDNEKYDVKHPFFDKISLFYGDITKIQVDAIVNAANSALMGGGGVDGAIHRAAGESALHAECRKHDRPLATGNAVVTDACRLSTHVKKIIHAVGPICHRRVTPKERKLLRSCYVRSMQLSEENDLRSIAFCCISTGIYGYNNDDAARTVLKFLYKYFSQEDKVEKWDRVVLCLFMPVDKAAYRKYIQDLVRDSTIFDSDEEEEEEEAEEAKEDEEKKKDDDKDEDKDGEKKEDKDEKKDEDNEKKDEEKEKKDEEKEKKEMKEDEKKESDTKKESEKSEDKVEASPEAKKEDTVSETEKTAVEGDESKKEEDAPSASNTSTEVEKMEEEQEGAKGDCEKENDEVDGSEEGVTGKKRVMEEKVEGEPLSKRDKHERESAV